MQNRISGAAGSYRPHNRSEYDNIGDLRYNNTMRRWRVCVKRDRRPVDYHDDGHTIPRSNFYNALNRDLWKNESKMAHAASTGEAFALIAETNSEYGELL